jgi:hypothetical protein
MRISEFVLGHGPKPTPKFQQLIHEYLGKLAALVIVIWAHWLWSKLHCHDSLTIDNVMALV